MSPADRSNSAYFCWFGRDWVREAGTTKMRIGSMWWMMLLGSFWMVVCSIKATECAIENILNIRKYIVRPRVLYTAVATDSDARKQKGMEICHIFFLKLFARMELPRWIFSFVRRGVPQISSLLQKRGVLRADCYILWTFPPTFPPDGLCQQWVSLKHCCLDFFWWITTAPHLFSFWNRRQHFRHDMKWFELRISILWYCTFWPDLLAVDLQFIFVFIVIGIALFF